ncbi:hypothetical protein FACS189475_09590 [Betaproteobacteria bacterium]|nr:hypothetical protein FACS189475_09590 [Betaproteobacteria bacterium]
MSEKVVVNEIVLLTVIVEKTHKDSLIALLSEAGGQLINTIYGKDLAREETGFLKEALGLVSKETRLVVTCLLPSEESGPMLKTLIEKFDLDKPNTGAAFTVPVETLSF